MLGRVKAQEDKVHACLARIACNDTTLCALKACCSTPNMRLTRAELCTAQNQFWLQGAQAIADVILGKVSPSARLPMSFYYSNYTRQARTRLVNVVQTHPQLAAHPWDCKCASHQTARCRLRLQMCWHMLIHVPAHVDACAAHQ